MFHYADILCHIFIFVVLVYGILPLAKILFTYFVKARFCSKRKELHKLGRWAVVTGATDGIGKAYSEKLAKDGMNILLISRSEEKLKNVAAELELKFKIKTDTFAADFTKTKFYDELEEHVKQMDIGVLVNNVGMFGDSPDYFISERYPKDFCHNMIHCNVMSLVMMCRIITPGMVLRRRGAIINVSSMAGTSMVPQAAVYCSTKRFVTHFSKTLTLELSHTGVSVQVIFPGIVASKMSKMTESATVPSVETYVDSALQLYGVASFTSGYIVHELQNFVIGNFPDCLSQLVIKLLITDLQNAHINSLKKKD